MESFAQFSSDLDAETRRSLEHGEASMEVLKQPLRARFLWKSRSPSCMPSSTITLSTSRCRMWQYEKSLYEYSGQRCRRAAVMDTIRTTGNLDKDTEEQIKAVLTGIPKALSRRIKGKEA